MRRHIMPRNYFLLMALLCLSAPLLAETAEEKGHAIAAESIARDTGWGDMKADMQMILRNKQGEESLREIRIQSLEQANDGDKSLTIFDKPLDVKGTAFLSFSHATEADDQWLYLPALKRVKRISSRNKSGPFMGSEFAYEDLSSFEIEKYTYKYIKDDTINEQTCFVVEQFPVDKNSGYTRRVVWIDQAEYRVQRAEFYDRKDSLLKTLSYSGYNQYLGKYWRPDKMDMLNHQTGKSTELLWKNYSFGNGLNDADFNKNSLKRAR
ncbi:outer membrane lipoprotein-sorting protein [Sedimenticola selenatireducens]|uniref:Outer membrane lipoprotein-sorting protein n=1 Tax=Sedimenticola selenatireducens TaxID=191960 RepID=A0A557SCR0_9GAMM|nr:outer membrane lipoprotein-sorting protein [Sedimenticola selenatireducens]TVT66941.1 MAG: outer membrane lipoprotein-sorting protein [Sedimenticola selenatireducens]